MRTDRKRTRLNSTLSLHDALPIYLLPPSDVELEQLLSRLPLAEPGRRLDTQIARLLSPDANRSEEDTSELHSFPTRRSSDLPAASIGRGVGATAEPAAPGGAGAASGHADCEIAEPRCEQIGRGHV